MEYLQYTPNDAAERSSEPVPSARLVRRGVEVEMLRMEIYPVMGGVEVYMHGWCSVVERDHLEHEPEKAASYVSQEEIDKLGVTLAVTGMIEHLVHEFPQLVLRSRC